MVNICWSRCGPYIRNAVFVALIGRIEANSASFFLPECDNDGMVEYLEDGDEAAAHGEALEAIV